MFKINQVFNNGTYSWCGPYPNLKEAKDDAVRRLRGCYTMIGVDIYKGEKYYTKMRRSEALEPEYYI